MDLADAIMNELAERYSVRFTKNPKWDRKAERAAWDAGLEYSVPEYIERPLVERRQDSCFVVDRTSDGSPSIRALTLPEIGEVVRSVIERNGHSG